MQFLGMHFVDDNFMSWRQGVGYLCHTELNDVTLEWEVAFK